MGKVLRIALVHDWLTGMRGGEKCLESAANLWPSAPLFTLLHKRGSVSPSIENRSIHASFLNRLPGWTRYYRYLLPVMPLAAKWKFPADTEAVLSFSHCVAKAAKPPEDVPHICYCFSPMRYAWHMRDSYFRKGLKAAALDLVLKRLREWDRRTSSRVTHFIAISETIRTRIRECYGRESEVIYPPVDTDFYTPNHCPREDFYLVVSALAPYKRFDLALEACAKLGCKLIVIGTGQEEKKLKALAGPNVQFLGWQSNEIIRDYYRRCRAVLFPAEEDFGIVPLEAQACGASVMAFGKGGATETLRNSGVFFEEQTVESLVSAMEAFEKNRGSCDPTAARMNAEPFGRERFERELAAFVESRVSGKIYSDSIPPTR